MFVLTVVNPLFFVPVSCRAKTHSAITNNVPPCALKRPAIKNNLVKGDTERLSGNQTQTTESFTMGYDEDETAD